jgi:hypothetical protein
MNRRDVLKLATAASLYPGSTMFNFKHFLFGKPLFAGWLDDAEARQKFMEKYEFPLLSQQNNSIRDTGKGKVALLWKYYEQLTGQKLQPMNQGDIGDCVSMGFGMAVDMLTATQIVSEKKNEGWEAPTATEIIYGGSRVEVGHNKSSGDGSTGAWAAEFLAEYGTLLRKKYLDWDFSQYSVDLSRKLGDSGVPDELEPLCKEHPVKTCTLVKTWEECRDSLANGYPVAMCSNLGFNSNRDKDGFLRRTWRPWYHCMAIIGVDDSFRRPGALVINSWGPDWVSGPTRNDQPPGSFWVDASTINSGMQQGDSYSLSNFVGYPQNELPDYNLF